MPKYLFIASDYKPRSGGIAMYVDSLARGIISMGESVHLLGVVEPGDSSGFAFLQKYEAWVTPLRFVSDRGMKGGFTGRARSVAQILRCLSPSVRHLLDTMPYFRESAASLAAVRRVVDEKAPDLVVLGHLDISLYGIGLLMRELQLQYGLIAHDSEVYRFGQPNDLARRGSLLKGAAWIAANSCHTRSLLTMWGIADDKIFILHPPLSYRALEESSRQCRHTNDPFLNIVTICRMVREKGVDIVLRALRMIDAKGIGFRYRIAGEGPDRVPLQRLAAELNLSDKVEFLGGVSEQLKWSLLRSADVFVMPSRIELKRQHEGFGLAFIEAGAMAVPVIGTKVGGIPEAILNEQTGILIEPECPSALAEALIRLSKEPKTREAMGEAGSRRARAEFAPGVIADRFQKEVSKRLDRGKSPKESRIVDSSLVYGQQLRK